MERLRAKKTAEAAAAQSRARVQALREAKKRRRMSVPTIDLNDLMESAPSSPVSQQSVASTVNMRAMANISI